MKPERKADETRAKVRRDFWIGFGAWLVINIPISLLVGIGFESGHSAALVGFAALVVNVVGLLVLARYRSRMALGALAVTGAALVIVSCAGVWFLAWCFSQPW